VRALFARVIEFKFWDNVLRVSLATADKDATRPDVYVGKIVNKSGGKRLLALVGDAVRDALPDSGMGVNDGHWMSQNVGTVVSDLKRLAVTHPTIKLSEKPKGKGKVEEGRAFDDGWLAAVPVLSNYQTLVGPRERDITCGLQRNTRNLFFTPAGVAVPAAGATGAGVTPNVLYRREVVAAVGVTRVPPELVMG
jgi:hypothetical protein